MPKNNATEIMGDDAVIIREGKVLLVQQRKPSAYGLWSFPGGHAENGESFETAVVREAREELGPVLEVQKPLYKNRSKTERGVNLELYTYIVSIRGEVTLLGRELMAYGWFSLDALEHVKDKLRSPLILRAASQVL